MKFIGIIGVLFFMGIAFLFSKNKKSIKLQTVFWGLILQILFSFAILGTTAVSSVATGIFIFLLCVYLAVTRFNRASFLRKTPFTALLAVIMAAALIFIGYIVGVQPSSGAEPYFISISPVVQTFWLLILVVWILRKFIQNQKFRLFPFNSIFFLVAVSLSFGGSLALAVATNGQFGTPSASMAKLSASVGDFLMIPTNAGAGFVFGSLNDPSGPWGFLFFVKVLPTIIFFSAFIAVLYYFGIVQVLIEEMARFMRWTMKTSGTETLSCAANIFIGQTEAPILVKPFVSTMTNSELHAIMSGGFATIAGGVFAGFVSMGINAGYLIGASIMSAPAALLLSKIWYPETEHSISDGETPLPAVQISDNVIGAAAQGTNDGLHLALNVGAMLLAFVALIEVANMGLRLINPDLSLNMIFGYIFRYLALILGTPMQDAQNVGALLGNKIALNEFVAYLNLTEMLKNGTLSPKAQVIATYALCGFANLSSIGIQIGGISMMAPERRADITRLSFSAMWTGAFASWMTAAIAGMFVG